MSAMEKGGNMRATVRGYERAEKGESCVEIWDAEERCRARISGRLAVEIRAVARAADVSAPALVRAAIALMLARVGG